MDTDLYTPCDRGMVVKCARCGKSFLMTDEMWESIQVEVMIDDAPIWCEECQNATAPLTPTDEEWELIRTSGTGTVTVIKTGHSLTLIPSEKGAAMVLEFLATILIGFLIGLVVWVVVWVLFKVDLFVVVINFFRSILNFLL